MTAQDPPARVPDPTRPLPRRSLPPGAPGAVRPLPEEIREQINIPGAGALSQTGKLFALAASILRLTFKRPFQFREFVDQFWFIASVTILPCVLVSIPFGAVIALQLGSLLTQFSAQNFTGAAGVVAVVQQASPVIVALLIAGAGGSAICADIGSRTIREEILAMESMSVSPIHRLIVPRVLAATAVAVFLNGLTSVVGVLGGYFLFVFLQHGTPGSYLSSFATLAQLPDLYVGEVKAVLFGFVAGVIAVHRGLNPRGGPKGVGDAVNQSVVIAFLLLFIMNTLLTTIYLQIVPAKGM